MNLKSLNFCQCGQRISKHGDGNISDRWDYTVKIYRPTAFDKVTHPKCINKCNKDMGGVDLHDLQVPRFHISIGFQKWWQPMFAWCLKSAPLNRHLFYRDVMGPPSTLLTSMQIVTDCHAKVWYKTIELWKKIFTGCYS